MLQCFGCMQPKDMNFDVAIHLFLLFSITDNAGVCIEKSVGFGLVINTKNLTKEFVY